MIETVDEKIYYMCLILGYRHYSGSYGKQLWGDAKSLALEQGQLWHLLITQPHSLFFVLSMAAFALQWQS